MGTFIKTSVVEELNFLLISIAFLSIDGIKCDILLFRGNYKLSNDILIKLQLLEVSVKEKYCGFFRVTAFTTNQH
jgi:hypothetical protein